MLVAAQKRVAFGHRAARCRPQCVAWLPGRGAKTFCGPVAWHGSVCNPTVTAPAAACRRRRRTPLAPMAASHGSPPPPPTASCESLLLESPPVDSVSGKMLQGPSVSSYASLQMEEPTVGSCAVATVDMPVAVTAVVAEEMSSTGAEADGLDRRYRDPVCAAPGCVVRAEVPPPSLELAQPPALPSAESGLVARQPHAPVFVDWFVVLLQGGYWWCQRAADAINSRLAAYTIRLRPIELELFLLSQLYGIKHAVQWCTVELTAPPSLARPAAAPIHPRPSPCPHAASSQPPELRQPLLPSLTSTVAQLPAVKRSFDVGAIVQRWERPAAAVTVMEQTLPAGPVELTPGKEPDVWLHGSNILGPLQGRLHVAEANRDQTVMTLIEAPAPTAASNATAEPLRYPPPSMPLTSTPPVASRMLTLTAFTKTLAGRISSALQGWDHVSAGASATLAALTGRRRPVRFDHELQGALARVCELHEVLASEREAVLRLQVELRAGLEAVAAMARARAEAEERAAREQARADALQGQLLLTRDELMALEQRRTSLENDKLMLEVQLEGAMRAAAEEAGYETSSGLIHQQQQQQQQQHHHHHQQQQQQQHQNPHPMVRGAWLAKTPRPFPGSISTRHQQGQGQMSRTGPPHPPLPPLPPPFSRVLRPRWSRPGRFMGEGRADRAANQRKLVPPLPTLPPAPTRTHEAVGKAPASLPPPTPRASSSTLSVPAAGRLLPPLLSLQASELLPLRGDFEVGLGPAEIRVQLRRVSQLAYDAGRQLLMQCGDDGEDGSIAAALRRRLCWPLETLPTPAPRPESSTALLPGPIPVLPQSPQQWQHQIPPCLPGDLEARLVAHSLLTWLSEEVWRDPLAWLGGLLQMTAAADPRVAEVPLNFGSAERNTLALLRTRIARNALEAVEKEDDDLAGGDVMGPEQQAQSGRVRSLGEKEGGNRRGGMKAAAEVVEVPGGGLEWASAEVAHSLAAWLLRQAGCTPTAADGPPPSATPSLSQQRRRYHKLLHRLRGSSCLRQLANTSLRLGLMVAAAHPRLCLTVTPPQTHVAPSGPRPKLPPRRPPRTPTWWRLGDGYYSGGEGVGMVDGGSRYTVVRKLCLGVRQSKSGGSEGAGIIDGCRNGPDGDGASDGVGWWTEGGFRTNAKERLRDDGAYGMHGITGARAMYGAGMSDAVQIRSDPAGAGPLRVNTIQPPAQLLQQPQWAEQQQTQQQLLLCTSQPGVSYTDEYGRILPGIPFLIQEEVHTWVETCSASEVVNKLKKRKIGGPKSEHFNSIQKH